MTTKQQRITIIGTGCIGTSIGLALRNSRDAQRLELVGHDKEPGAVRRAEKTGALDRVEFNLDLALRGARLVILAVPLAEMREVLSDLGRLLEPDSGVVVTDTTHLKVPVLQWAGELLPRGAHFIGGDPLLAPAETGWGKAEGTESASAELFHRALYAITARPEDHPGAVKAVTNLARVLGAEPFFMDPAEHDAARILSDALPDFLATALLWAAVTTPGWDEVRKTANHSFSMATAAAAGLPPSRRMLALLGKETLLRGLDGVMERLAALRAALEQGDADTLDEAFKQVDEARYQWLVASRDRAWEAEPGAPDPADVFQRSLQALIGDWSSKP